MIFELGMAEQQLLIGGRGTSQDSKLQLNLVLKCWLVSTAVKNVVQAADLWLSPESAPGSPGAAAR